MLFRFLILIHVCAAFPLKCPEPAQWSLRARSHCPDASKYFCLRNDLINGYSENCTVYDFLQPGRKNVLRGGLDADVCSAERYQPWPLTFHTNVSTNCIFLKSTCNEEGQVVYGIGTRNTDTTCICDYTNGYDFIVKPRNPCFCVPLVEDCSCYSKTCPDSTLILASDYKCSNSTTNKSISQCRTIAKRRNKELDQPKEKHYISRNDNIIMPVHWKTYARITVNIVCIGLTLILCVDGLLDKYYRKAKFKRLLANVTTVEGSETVFECETEEENSPVKWFKDGVRITDNTEGIKMEYLPGYIYRLTILHTSLQDKGIYRIKKKGPCSEAVLEVKAMFKTQLTNVVIMEGLDTIFECELEAGDSSVEWFKDDVQLTQYTENIKQEVLSGDKYKLTIAHTRLQDGGKYSVRRNDIKSDAELIVKEMPETIKQMSELDRQQFLEATKSGTTKRYYIRVMIIGEGSAGKTCLLRRLMNQSLDGVRSTDGIDIERQKCQIDVKTGEWVFSTDLSKPSASSKSSTTVDDKHYTSWSSHNEQFANCGFWDFAGQKEFYATHQTFLSANAVYLLAVDISKDFTTRTYNGMIETDFNSIGEYIEFWLDNIHCYSKDVPDISSQQRGELNPPVVIVGTRIDKYQAFEREPRMKCFKDHLETILCNHAKRRHIRKTHFLSNTLPSDNQQEFVSLREDIFERAQSLKNWGDNLPTRWLVLEKEIHRQIAYNKFTLTYSEVVDLAITCSFSCGKEETSELDSFLRYEHDIGNIIFFDDVKQFIVLEPKWLVDVFKCFVSHQYKDELIHMPEWSDFKRTGKLLDNLISESLKKVPHLSLEKHKDFVLKIMAKFDIIVKPLNADTTESFYMPCMITPAKPETVISEHAAGACKKTSWFCLEFDFLPPSYFNHILVCFMRDKQLKTNIDKQLCIHRNIGLFNINDQSTQVLIICLSKNVIGMQVLQWNDEQIRCTDFKNKLIDLVISTTERYRMNITYKKQFKCSDGCFYDEKGRVDFDVITKSNNYRCAEHNITHSSKEIYDIWLKEEHVKEVRDNMKREKGYFIKQPLGYIELIEGETVELSYMLSSSKLVVSFLKDDHFLPETDSITKNVHGRYKTLKFTNVKPNDTGKYCLAVAEKKSSITELIVHRSFIEEPPSDIQLVEGQTVELKYKLLNDRLTCTFLKNDLFLPALKNIEKFVDGVWKKLKITNITQKDVGMYCLEVAGHRSRLTKVIIKPMFTSTIGTQYCTEGNKIEMTCSVHTANIEVKWYKKDSEMHQSNNILITSSGNQHTLSIVETTVKDSGTYCVEAENVEMEFSITVKAIFKRRLIDITTMEGIDIKLVCETVEENCHVLWFKDDEEIDSPTRMTIERTHGCLHTLSLAPTSLEDSGTYSIKISGATSVCKVYVKEMPEAIKLMSIQDREEFLKAAKSGITKRHTIRVMIVGEKSAGKTCLLRRLMDDKIDDVKSTDGINIERRKCQIEIETGKWHFRTAGQNPHGSPDHMEQFADCGFWDFAGQREFYATHQTFLSSNAVYLLVVDISKDFTNKTYDKMIEKEFDSIGEYIDFWLDNIHCYSRDDTNTPKHHNENNLLNPPVIIVGTGIDKLSEVEKQQMEFEHNVSQILSRHAKRRHLRKIHYVSNTLPSDDKQEFKSLREDIFRHAKALTTWGDNLPTRWVVLEKEINTMSPEHVISYTDAENLAMICSFHDDSQMTLELDSFLKFEHDIGNLIFFEDVRNFIVLDPKWLMDTFRCFVSHQYTNESIGMPEWDELERTGKLADKLIQKLLEKVPDLNSPERKEFVLQIMEKFDIIVRPINHYARNDFYMPCMIKAEPFHNIIGRSESEDERKSSWFCLKFKFLPPSYFNHILVSFVKRKELLVEKNKRLRIYRNIGEFQLNTSGSRTLVICLSTNAVAMQVRQLNCSEDICFSDVKDVLVDLVDSIKQRYGINITYTIKFKCSDGIYNCKRIDLEKIMETSQYRCKEHETMHSSKEIYSSWLTEEEADIERKNKNHRGCNYCKNMSVYKCYDCNKVLCKDCSRKHDNEKKYEGHSMQLISDSFILNCKFPLGDDIYGRRLITDIKCLPDGDVVATVYTTPELLVFSISGTQRHVIQLDTIPIKMDVVDKNTVAVLLKKDIVAIIDIQQNHVQYIRNSAMPYGLGTSFIYIENKLYIGYKYGIVVFDKAGKERRRITLSFTPCGMCYGVDSQRIYCIDSDNSKLICIDRDGNDIFTFTYPKYLKDLTVDNEGNVLVLCEKEDDRTDHVIKVDSNGEKSEEIITNISTPRLNYRRICYDHLTNSVVIGLGNKVYFYKKK